MVWDEILCGGFVVAVLAAGVRLATPVVIAAVGEVFTERAGILNIGIEGLMLVGAFFGFLGGHYAGNPWVGALTGTLAGAIISIVHAYLSVTLGADQVVSGIALNFLSTGLATLLNRGIFGIPLLPPQAEPFKPLAIPVLSSLPVLGPVLFQHHALVYVGVAVVAIAYVVLFKTNFGLHITAAGENPWASEAVGVDVVGVRYFSVLVGGALAGLAGASLSLAQLSFFKETMVAGRGYIAIAVVMFGRWNPIGGLGAALLFGVADALQLRLQMMGLGIIPPEALVSIPYLVTIIVVASRIGRATIPKALAVPYVREV
jgi:ABC-type uncharacterized transport system permease subunit